MTSNQCLDYSGYSLSVQEAEPGAAPDRGRYTGFARYNGLADGPGR